MKEPAKKIEMISDKKFLRFFDIQYEEGRHYYAVSRREPDETFAVLPDKEAKFSIPDAVTIVLIIEDGQGNSYIYMNYEYRYATGRFLLSPPAGLIDKEERADAEKKLKRLCKQEFASPEEAYKKFDRIIYKTLIGASIRELKEETGYDASKARFRVISKLVFSSPGMSDESNALVKCILKVDDISKHEKDAPDGSELFNGFELLTKAEARRIIKEGRDRYGNFYSAPAYIALKEFVG